MPKSRIILLVLLAVAAILAIQNWSGAISLMFLGMKTAPLPLSVWMLLGVASGALTSGLISILFGVRSGSAQPTGGSRPRPPETPPPERDRDNNKNHQSGRSDRSPPIEERQKEERQKEDLQDREEEESEEFLEDPRYQTPNYNEEPWDDEEDWLPEPEERFSSEDAGREAESASQQNFPNRRTVYEIPQEPVGETHSGSMYSYTYKNKDDSNSDPEKKSTYDASNLEDSTRESSHKEIERDADDLFEDILDPSGDSETPRKEPAREPARETEYDDVRDSDSAAREPIPDPDVRDSNRDSESAARDAVTDANYRVIEPPSQPLDPNGKKAALSEGDDDWGKKQYNNDDDW